MKLINLLSEIKIQPPSSTFEVTETGKEAIKKFDEFFDLLYFFRLGDLENEIFDNLGMKYSPKSVFDNSYYLRRLIMIGAISDEKPNRISEVIKIAVEDGYEKESIESTLKNLSNLDFITKVNL
jgi:hypothetical protein